MAPRQRLSTPPSSVRSDDSTGSLLSEDMPKQEEDSSVSDVAREHHDYFNLIALLFVIGTTLSDWDFDKVLRGYSPAEAFSGQYFYLNWATSVLYFLVDLIWVSKVPNCVKSPDVIVKHHMVAIAYLSGPILYPEYRWLMGACLSVEINTWFLILRRVVYKRKEQPLLCEVVSAAFYLSWIVIRCFIYPALLFNMFHLYHKRLVDTHQLWHFPMIFIPIHFSLCLLNLKWSYDLFQPIVRKWVVADAQQGQPSKIANGL
jgi:hypothetical protein